MKSICILGLGYIGLPTLAMFATNGLKVVGVDVNERIVATLNNGDIHIKEPGLKNLIQVAFNSGNIRIKNRPEFSDAFLIAVPTPFKHDEFGSYNGKEYKKADMSFVVSATEMIVPFLRKGNLVVLESTSPLRTTVDLVKPILEKSGLKAGEDFYLVYSPERVLPGQILKELTENPRVIGGLNYKSAEKGKELYSTFVKGKIFLTDATTAEMIKLMENTYRDINIAIANEFSRLADEFGIDIWETISIANQHPRVKILNPGPGVGGHCISVDPWFLIEAAPQITDLICTARQVNDTQPHFVVQLVQRLLGNLKGKEVAVLGITYKPNVNDFRESPAIEVMKELITLGCEVRAFDPYATSYHELGNYLVSSFKEAISNADLLLLLVDHTEFKSLTPETCIGMKRKIILDTRNCLNVALWQQAGFDISILGNAK